MISKAIIRAYQEKYLRKWEVLYFAVDLHGTIIERYTGKDINAYNGAEEVLRYLSNVPHIVLILYTSTSREDLAPFYEWCSKKGITFKYLNENPECLNNKTGDFSKKFYFNVLLDDRAGFDPTSDWSKTMSSVGLAQLVIDCPHIAKCTNSLKHSLDLQLCRSCVSNNFAIYAE